MEIFYLTPFLILLLIGLSIIVQGLMIINAKCGYSKSPKVKHPELNDVKAGDSLLMFKFTDQDLDELQKIIIEQKMKELFEEPSTYEDENDDN